MEKEKAVAQDYKEKAKRDDPQFMRVYHLMTIHKELEICKFLADNSSTFSPAKDFNRSFEFHMDRMERHAQQVYSSKEVAKLMDAAHDELKRDLRRDLSLAA